MRPWRRTVAAASLAFAVCLSLPGLVLAGSPGDPRPLEEDLPGVRWIRITNGLPTTLEYYGVAPGDINNDGKLDIVAQSGGLHAFVSDGLGAFAEQSTGFAATGLQAGVVLADFNNDGDLDAAGDGVYFGNGGRGGSMVWTQTTSPGGSYSIEAADLNLDGKMDLVAAGPSGVDAWTGDGGAGGTMVWTASSGGLPSSGTFFGCRVGDLDRDGKPDIVCADNANGIRVWTGNGGTGAGALWTDVSAGSGLPTGASYMDVALGDVNHDGCLDILSTGYYSPVGVRAWLGNGGAGGVVRFTQNSTGLRTGDNAFIGVSLQDANDDGDLDVLAAHYGGLGLRLWLGDGGTGGAMDWTEVSAGLPTGNYIEADAGDINNDGKVDLITSHNRGVDVWQNERPDFAITSYVSASVNLPATNTWADVQMADVNRDGRLDLGFTSYRGQDLGVKVYLGDGQGIWTPSLAGLPIQGDYSGMRFADLDHDGALDLVAAKEGGAPGDTGVHVWRGDGAGSWAEMAQVTTRSGAGLELGDVNNDGNLDVVTGYWGNSWGPMVFLGNGAFGWGADVGPASTMNVDDMAVADVNHDGKEDIAASSMNGVGVQIWTGDGSGTATGWTRNDTGLPTTGVYLGLAFGDVNHDGNSDLAAAGYAGAGQGVYVWLGNGGAGGTMQWTAASTGLPGSGQYGGIEFLDTDLDGDPDLIAADARNVGPTGIVYRRGNGGASGTMGWSAPSIAGIPVSGQYWGLGYGDMDSDGIPDIAVTGTAGVQVYKQGSAPPQPPVVALSTPDGLGNWTGGTAHAIRWNMSDNSPNPGLVVYLNFTYGGGAFGGAIAGPLAGTANPNSYLWMTPSVDATDVVVNLTVIDPDGLRGWGEADVPAIDSNPPGVVFTSPGDAATDVGVVQPITIRFDDRMQRGPTASAFGITPDPGGWSWAWSTTVYPDDTLTGTHPAFAYGQSYAVTVSQAALDGSSPGNPLGAPYAFSFTTVNPNSLPSIAFATPLAGRSLSGGSSCPIGFIASDPEDPPGNLVVWINYSLTGGAPWLPVLGPVPGDSPSFGWTVPFANATTAYLRAEVLDTVGGQAAATDGPFEIDSAPPAVMQTSPVADAVNVPRNVVLQATWSEGMDTDATNASFLLRETVSGLSVAGQISWSGSTFTFRPDADLGAIMEYTATFSTQAEDDSDPGNPMPSVYGWSFTTAAVADDSPPTITGLQTSPSPQSVGGGVNVSAVVMDDFGVLAVFADIRGPSGTANVSMAYDAATGRYYVVDAYAVAGVHSYTIWASDTAGNWAYATGTFEITDEEPPTDGSLFPWILLALLIVAVLVVAAFLAYRRRRRGRREEGTRAGGAKP